MRITPAGWLGFHWTLAQTPLDRLVTNATAGLIPKGLGALLVAAN
jgi:hypothetical protein